MHPATVLSTLWKIRNGNLFSLGLRIEMSAEFTETQVGLRIVKRVLRILGKLEPPLNTDRSHKLGFSHSRQPPLFNQNLNFYVLLDLSNK